MSYVQTGEIRRLGNVSLLCPPYPCREGTSLIGCCRHVFCRQKGKNPADILITYCFQLKKDIKPCCRNVPVCSEQINSIGKHNPADYHFSSFMPVKKFSGHDIHPFNICISSFLFCHRIPFFSTKYHLFFFKVFVHFSGS